MITREQLVADIDLVDDANIEVLHKIILALKAAKTPTQTGERPGHQNPLKNSVTFEKDILSPIDDEWSADR
jgi:hypothetical protein